MRTVLRFLQWFLFLVVALIVVTFVVQNRDVVDVRLWPLPYVMPAPLFAVIIACVLLGFVVGAFSAWLSGGGARKRARELGRLNAEKAQQISQLRQQLEAQKQAGPQSRPPAITHAA
ncbi:LapA family protein [Dongia deserti]|uniref:LapA family protein n=1 Tax=Dongia deserti TaxID=2268030 RepID=UPI000E653563|nr:LapA family protein [Dongia deserti]